MEGSKKNLSSVITILGLGLFLVALPSQAQTFADYSFDYLKRQRLMDSAPTSFVGDSPETPLQIEEEFALRKPLLKLYTHSLKTKPTRWTQQTLPEGYRLPASGIGYPLPNDILLRAYKDKTLLGIFRPVATVTGCNSGCLPVVFHLRASANGRVESLIEDPARPLTKANHEKLSVSDKKRLLEIAQKLPEALEWIDGPSSLADEVSIFPPSTWSTLRPALVPQAAYTSYRVFEAALGVHDFLQRSKAAKRENDRERALEVGGEWFRSSSVNEIKKRLMELPAQLRAVGHPSAELRMGLRFVGPASVWLLQQGSATPSEIAELLKGLPHWGIERKNDVAAFYRELISNPRTFSKASDLLSREDLPFEPLALKPLFKALAKSAKGEKIDEKILNEDVLAGDLALLSLTIDRLRGAGQSDALTRFEALRALRYPKLAASQVWMEDSGHKHAKLLEEARTQRKNDWIRGLSSERREFPKILAKRHGDGKLVQLPLPATQSHLHVYFAAWCPHCQDTLKRWVRASFKASTWERIHLIEVFPGDRSIADFCKITGLTAKDCHGIVSVGDLSKNPTAQAQLGVESVPKMVVLDASRRVRFSDLRLPENEYVDIEQEILSVLDAAN